MVHIPFFEKKVDSSELATMVKQEIGTKKLDRSDHRSGESYAKTESGNYRSNFTRNTTGKSNKFPGTVISGKINREAPIERGSMTDTHGLQCPLSPPEFPLRPSAGLSPAKVSPSKKSPSLTFRLPWNPFADAEPSGNTPRIPQIPDSQPFQMKVVEAEQMPIIVTPDGPRPASPNKGEFVVDKGFEQVRMQNQTLSKNSADSTEFFPIRRISSAKQKLWKRTTPLRLKRSQPNGSTDGICEGSSSSVDYLQVKIPHMSFDAEIERIWSCGDNGSLN